MVLLTLPLEIWHMVFDLLPGQDLQSISKIPKLRFILTTTPSSMHRLEVHKAGMVETPFAGSRPLAERSELLKAFRARWESLRWTEVTQLPSSPLCHCRFARTTMVYTTFELLSIMYYLRLPFGGVPASLGEDRRFSSNNGVIRGPLPYFGMNLLVALEQWHENASTLRVRLHIMQLESAREITIPHDGQLKVCEPFAVDIDLDVIEWREYVTCGVEQHGRHVGILFACYSHQKPARWAKFMMWDVITQLQVVNINSLEYRTFLFLDHRWVLFGGVRKDPGQDTGCPYYPYLEIVDPTDNTYSTTLELDRPVFKSTSTSRDPRVHIRVLSGADHEKGSLAENGGMPFVSDSSRGIVSAEVSWSDSEDFELREFVLDIEDVLSMVPSSSDIEKRRVEWKDLSHSTAIFAYDSESVGQYAILSRYSSVAGFRYVSPTLPLDPEDQMGPMCFFVYDFNPHREALDPLPDSTPEEPDPETGYRRSASEITREVVGGLSCWKMRFDLPAPDEDLDGCQVALTDGGPVLLESYDTDPRVGFITVFSIW